MGTDISTSIAITDMDMGIDMGMSVSGARKISIIWNWCTVDGCKNLPNSVSRDSGEER